jgi:hypothetical protein
MELIGIPVDPGCVTTPCKKAFPTLDNLLDMHDSSLHALQPEYAQSSHRMQIQAPEYPSIPITNALFPGYMQDGKLESMMVLVLVIELYEWALGKEVVI